MFNLIEFQMNTVKTILLYQQSMLELMMNKDNHGKYNKIK